MTYTIPAEALERFDLYAREGRIIRHEWRGMDSQGRETACLLAALDPERINHASACPANWLPPWLAYLTPLMDDYTSAEAWPSVIARYQRVLRGIHRLTPEGSERAMWRTLDAALAIAQPHDRAGVVTPVRALLAQALSGFPPTAAEWQAARAAAAAAWKAAWAADAAARRRWAAAAAEAAAWAAEADAVAWAADAADAAAWAAKVATAAAAEAAEDAAEAAEGAAEGAALAAWAAAKAAAWDQIAFACLGALLAEIETEGAQ